MKDIMMWMAFTAGMVFLIMGVFSPPTKMVAWQTTVLSCFLIALVLKS